MTTQRPVEEISAEIAYEHTAGPYSRDSQAYIRLRNDVATALLAERAANRPPEGFVRLPDGRDV